MMLWLDEVVFRFSFKTGLYEQHDDGTKKILEFMMKKGIGLFVIAVLTSLSITGIIQYLQVSKTM